jgi:hypothetical protein
MLTPLAPLDRRPLHKSEKLDSELLRHTPSGQEGKGQISLAQPDEREPFCHSEEQRDEESRGCAKVSLSGVKQPPQSPFSGGGFKIIPPCQGGSGGLCKGLLDRGELSPALRWSLADSNGS